MAVICGGLRLFEYLVTIYMSSRLRGDTHKDEIQHYNSSSQQYFIMRMTSPVVRTSDQTLWQKCHFSSGKILPINCSRQKSQTNSSLHQNRGDILCTSLVDHKNKENHLHKHCHSGKDYLRINPELDQHYRTHKNRRNLEIEVYGTRMTDSQSRST